MHWLWERQSGQQTKGRIRRGDGLRAEADKMSKVMMCPDCGTMLMNHGAESQGDGDIYDVWYCNECHCTKYRFHSWYCDFQVNFDRGFDGENNRKRGLYYG